MTRYPFGISILQNQSFITNKCCGSGLARECEGTQAYERMSAPALEYNLLSDGFRLHVIQICLKLVPVERVFCGFVSASQHSRALRPGLAF
jgi:hypothetical protein